MKVKTYIEAGCFVRGTIKRELLKACYVLNIKCYIKEDKGLFESVYYLTLDGETESIEKINHWLRNLSK